MNRIKSIRDEIPDRPIRATDGYHAARLARVAENLLSYIESGQCDPDDDRLMHVMSRIGIWARGLATDVRAGGISNDDAARLLDKLADLGDDCFELRSRN